MFWRQLQKKWWQMMYYTKEDQEEGIPVSVDAVEGRDTILTTLASHQSRVCEQDFLTMKRTHSIKQAWYQMKKRRTLNECHRKSRGLELTEGLRYGSKLIAWETWNYTTSTSMCSGWYLFIHCYQCIESCLCPGYHVLLVTWLTISLGEREMWLNIVEASILQTNNQS